MKNTINDVRGRVIELTSKNDYVGAYPVLKKLLKMESSANGPASRETAKILNWLGLCLISKGEPKEAQKEIDKAIKIADGQTEWADSYDKACFLTNAGLCQYMLGNMAEGDSLFLHAARLRKYLTKPDDPNVVCFLRLFGDQSESKPFDGSSTARAIWLAEYMYGIGYMSCVALDKLVEEYEGRKSYDEAKAILQHLMNRYMNLFGPCSLYYGDACYRLASYCDKTNDPSTGIICHTAALAVQRFLPEQNTHSIMVSLDGLADLTADLGLTTIAEENLTRLLALTREHNPGSIDLANVLERLSRIHMKNDEFAKAATEREEALAISRATKEDREIYINRLIGLGAAYEQQGKHEDGKVLTKALQTYKRALQLAGKKYGTMDVHLVYILTGLATVHCHIGDKKESIRLYERTLTILQADKNTDLFRIAKIENDLAMVHLHFKDYIKAEELLEHAASVVESAPAPKNRQLLKVLNNLAIVVAAAGKKDESIRLMERAVQLQEDIAGANSPELITHLQNLGRMQALAENRAAAEQNYNRAIMISSQREEPWPAELNDLSRELKSINAGKFRKPITSFHQWKLD